MTDLVFIFGKNWMLSLAELIVYLEDRGLLRELKDYSKMGAVVTTSRPVKDGDIIDIQGALGGCFKVARLFHTYPLLLLKDAFPNKGTAKRAARNNLEDFPWLHEVFGKPRGKKITYGVSTYPSQTREAPAHYLHFTRGMNEYIKKQLLEKGAKKADYIVYDKPDQRNPRRINTSLWPHTIAKHKLLKRPNAEILAVFTESSVYLARTIAVYDSMLQQYRDESRPFISAEISTSPKVCRTLLTLAGAKPGDTILDPFCGSGTLLMEAALQDMNCIGIDIDGNAVSGTQRNLIWLGKDLGVHINFSIQKGDAREADKIVHSQVDAVAFEPHLGPLFRKRQNWDEAERIIVELTLLYRATLKAIGKILRPDGRIAMTIPVILTHKGDISIDIKQMLKGTEFEVYKLLPHHVFSKIDMSKREIDINTNRTILPERKRGQIVQRAVVMLGRG
ncbi:MAG: DNA methyltransferase [Candidatus Thorarchaeota archaeon]|nr:DNA methyltransferase [Candidatus Thorarchaeota archaeon]